MAVSLGRVKVNAYRTSICIVLSEMGGTYTLKLRELTRFEENEAISQ